MFAIFKTGGKQYKASVGDKLYIEKIDGNDDDFFVFNEILMIDEKVGNPFINGAGLRARIIKNGKSKKLKVVRYHPKKNINKIYGHRQPYTLIEVSEILSENVSKFGLEISKKTNKLNEKSINDKSDKVLHSNKSLKMEKLEVPKKIDEIKNVKSKSSTIKKDNNSSNEK